MKLQELKEIELLFCSENNWKAKQREIPPTAAAQSIAARDVSSCPSQLNAGFLIFSAWKFVSLLACERRAKCSFLPIHFSNRFQCLRELP